jgi:hypothetical protein
VTDFDNDDDGDDDSDEVKILFPNIFIIISTLVFL